MAEKTTRDIRDELIGKYEKGDFRDGPDAFSVQQPRTVEIQDASFVVDKPWILREPNYAYAEREIEWYGTMSLKVSDIPGGAPKMWGACASRGGEVNSNYGWCVFSPDNFSQYWSAVNMLLRNPSTREACMIYNRPGMQRDWNRDGMHDFMCTFSTQQFLNPTTAPGGEKGYSLDYIVYMRSNDAVFGFPNDALWHIHLMKRMSADLAGRLGAPVVPGKLRWHAGSLHVYERHFRYLERGTGEGKIERF